MIAASAMASARSRLNLTHPRFDEDTQFVEEAFKWLLAERSYGRLTSGAPMSFVLFDFRPPIAAAIGPQINLKNGNAQLGAVHLSNPTLTAASIKLGATGLATFDAFADALATHQLSKMTSVTYDPNSGSVEIRLACLPGGDPLRMRLNAQLPQNWSSGGLGQLTTALNLFHSQIHSSPGGLALLADANGLRSGARITYRNAVFLYLTYELGLTQAQGYRVVTANANLRVTEVGTAASAVVSAIGTRTSDVSVAAAQVGRSLAIADRRMHLEGVPTHISCIACPHALPPTQECANPPISLRHRHV